MVTLRLGSRKSLLAKAQSQAIAKRLEKKHQAQSLKIEWIGIETRGDQIQDKPLSQIEGKEFFVAELDQALLDKKIDFVVHSLKDLSLERPPTIQRAAIPTRVAPHDVLVLNSSATHKPLKIGTSSPRRLQNIPSLLKQVFPNLIFEFVEIRGNVNTRLSRLHEDSNSPRKLDGVILAYAGLIRLLEDAEACAEIQKHLHHSSNTRSYLLPVSENPTAPGQGALAIECRTDDRKSYEFLHVLNDEETEKSVQKERAILEEFGGGCHQRFGATYLSLANRLFIKGLSSQNQCVNDVRLDKLSFPKTKTTPTDHKIWDGSERRFFKEKARSLSPQEIESLRLATQIFVSHSRAYTLHENFFSNLFDRNRTLFWTSGLSSWKRLAQTGVTVLGCADGLGFDSLKSFINSPVFSIQSLSIPLVVLTHQQALRDWTETSSVRAIATYELEVDHQKYEAAIAQLKNASHAFWASGSQFEAIRAHLTNEQLKPIHHACGPGKTASLLKRHGFEPEIFSSSKEWKSCITED